jgi:hypothetical protein
MTNAGGLSTFASQEWTGAVDGQKVTAGTVTLDRVERTSPTEGAKPLEGAVLGPEGRPAAEEPDPLLEQRVEGARKPRYDRGEGALPEELGPSLS